MIDDEDSLLRRVANRPDMLKRDGGMARPSSAAFKPHGDDGDVSVDVRRLLPDPSAPLEVLAGLPEHGLVEIFARKVRQTGLEVVHAPLPENPAHGNITGLAALSKKEQRRAQRELALAAAWICQPGVRV